MDLESQRDVGYQKSGRLNSSSFSESEKFPDTNERRPRNWFCATFCCCLRSRAQPDRYGVKFPAHRMRNREDTPSASSAASCDEFLQDNPSAGSTSTHEPHAATHAEDN